MSDLFFFKDDYLIHQAKKKPWTNPKQSRFQDPFDVISYTDVEPIFATDAELQASVGSVLIADTECYSNYWMAAFRTEEGKLVVFIQDELRSIDKPKLCWILENFCIVGFNIINYDLPMLKLAAKGATNKTLFQASCQIIHDDLRVYDFEKRYLVNRRIPNFIDLIEVAPLRGSLKLYSGRLHTKRMQDLPIDPMLPLTADDKENISAYCFNDLVSTGLVFVELKSQLLLRVQMSHQYQVDLRSKSDAQIAEAVISSELSKLSGTKCERPNIPDDIVYRYKVPHFINYRTPVLQNMLEVVRRAEFVLDGAGYVEMPKSIGDLALSIGQCVYRMGIGGLHSTEKTTAHKADEDTLLMDIDVESFYPKIILNQGLFPTHLGRAFLEVYRTIVERRIKAKNEGDKVIADSLKITINGSFGKLGSKWSVLYAPDLMIQVTVSGQLCLLMLIEMIEDLGIPVVSANTDGIVVKCPKTRYDELQERVTWWKTLTDFKMEESRYKAIYSRDVNNYIAHKEDGKCKVKGTYAERGSAGNSVLSKNPENLICNDAVLAIIEKGTPVEETIRGCNDIQRFVTIRNVTGGARKSQVYLGKVIRWYYSTQMKGEINRATKGDKIPNTDRARPLMELPDTFPSDVDYERYIEAANEILYDIGYYEGLSKAAKRCLGELFVND